MLDALEADSRAELVCAADILPRSISWIWNGWLAAGKFHILAGAPGTGKTTLAILFAATVTRGGGWPDGSHADPGSVAIWSGEDDPADTLVPRLMAAGADTTRVHFVHAVTEDGRRRPFDPALDVRMLADALRNHCDVRMLIIDPVVSAVAGDSHKNAEVRRSLQPLGDLAAALQCAVIGITHLSKGTAGREPTERVTGSLAFAAVARVVMLAAKVQADVHDPARLLVRTKSNIGPDDGGFEYRLEQFALSNTSDVVASRVVWGEPVSGNARDLLSAAESAIGGDAFGEGGNPAQEWLSELLSQGPVSSKDVLDEGRSAGFSKDQVYRAGNALGVQRTKAGFAGGWRWSLPAKIAGETEDREDRTLPEPRSSRSSQSSAPDDLYEEVIE